MRVIYDATTGRVSAFGGDLEPGEGEAVAELTPDETNAKSAAAALVEDLGARLRNAVAEYEAAQAAYDKAADGVRERWAAAEHAARTEGGEVGFHPKKGFVTIAALPQPEPTPDEDEARVTANPDMAALLRVIRREMGGGAEKAARKA